MRNVFLAVGMFALAAGLIFIPKSTDSQFPFDFSSKSGQVLGAQTSFFEQFKNIFNHPDSLPPTTKLPPLEKEATKSAKMPPIKLTDTQKIEIKNRMTAIETKRRELKAMEDSFRVWLKANNLPEGLLNSPVPGFSHATPSAAKNIPPHESSVKK